MAQSITINLLKRVLLSPWSILLGLAAGVVIGIYNKPLASLIAPLGDMYLNLLQMCVLPIMITAVITGLGNLLRTGKAALYLKRMAKVYMLGLITVGVFSLGVGLLVKPGQHLSQADRNAIGAQLAQTGSAKTLATENLEVNQPKSKIVSFVVDIIPHNIFAAMSGGQNIAVLFFCLALGIAFGMSKAEGSRTALQVIESASDALLIIVGWTMYGLPIGLCGLLAGYIAHVGIGILIILFKLILLYCGMSLLLLLIFSAIIWRRTGVTYAQTWSALKDPLIIAFSTRSSFAAMPAIMRSMHEKLNLNKQTVDLLVPVGVMLNPLGSVMDYSLAAIFMSQLYTIHFGMEQFAITLVTAIGASLAATGIPSIAALGILAMVLDPLGLPVGVGMLLFAAVGTVTDTLITMLNVQANCTATAIIAGQNKTSG